MTASGPLRTVWDALERDGWNPQGPEHKFRARCPAHNGDDRNMYVAEGSDGRALLHCFSRGCSVDSIRQALGLPWGALFPVGHADAIPISELQAQPRKGVSARVASILAGLDDLREPYVFQVFCRCQFCGSDGAWLRAHSGGEVHIDCPNGCRTRAFMQGLSGRVVLESEKPKRRRSRV
jgi:hypothetical protein